MGKTKPSWMRKCPACGRQYKVYDCYWKRGTMRYCSVKCGMTPFRINPVITYGAESYYVARTGYFISKRGKSLHREVWKSHHGTIPIGYVIHHKDGNPANNDISNLELVEWGQHSVNHWKEKLPVIEMDGLKLTPPEWRRRLKYSKDLIQKRLRMGWPPDERVLVKPKRK